MNKKRRPSSNVDASIIGAMLAAAFIAAIGQGRARRNIRPIPDYSKLSVDRLLDELSAANSARDRQRAKLIKRWLKIKTNP